MMFAQDPLYAGDWLGDALITGLKVLVAFAFLLVAVMLNIWFLRKVISDFQNRIGPNTAGRWGILQSLADGIKLFFKEDLIPDNSDRFAFKLAPYLSLVPAFLERLSGLRGRQTTRRGRGVALCRLLDARAAVVAR